MKPSQFSAWCAKQRIPYNIPQAKVEKKQVVINKPKLVFGQAIPKR